MQFFLYARKSTDEDDRQMLSIESQLVELRELAAKEHLTIVEEFTESKTAKKPGRPVFNTMIERIKKGEASGILAWHPDRLSRNSIEGGEIVYLLDTGVLDSLRFPTFWFENTPQGKFVLSIALGMAKYAIDNLAENVKRGIRQKLRRGEYPGEAPVGYLNEPRLRTIVVNEPSADIVRKLFDSYATGRYSLQDITDRAASLGLRSNRGNVIAKSRIPVMLSNSFYMGIFRYNDELHQGSHEPLVSKKLFDRVQEILSKRGRVETKHAERLPLLGLIRCGECGAYVTAERQKGHRYYRCTKKKGSCSQRRYTREELLGAQLRRSGEIVALTEDQKDGMLDQIAIWRDEERKDAGTRVKAEESKLAAVSEKLDRLLDAFLEECVSRNEYARKKESLLTRQATQREKVAEVQSHGNKWLEPVEAFVTRAHSTTNALESDDLGDLRGFHVSIGSNLFLSDSGGSVAGRGTALDGSPASPGRRAALETTGDGIGSAVSVLAPIRASDVMSTRENLHPRWAGSARAEIDPEDRPPRSPEHQSKHGARQAGRMTEVPEHEPVAVREDRENMPPMIAAVGDHSDRVFCFAPPPPRRLSSGRKSRQGVHAGNRTAGPKLFVQYPGPWEILASWNASRLRQGFVGQARNRPDKAAEAAGRRCRPEWWAIQDSNPPEASHRGGQACDFHPPTGRFAPSQDGGPCFSKGSRLFRYPLP